MLTPEIDSSVLIGYPAAETYLRFDGHPSTVYLEAPSPPRSPPSTTSLPPRPTPRTPARSTSASPRRPSRPGRRPVRIQQPVPRPGRSVALLVGAVGVANIMVISVLERRNEIGLRRALGATRGHIRNQFLSEAILLALLGGTASPAGVLTTAIYATTRGWAIVVPPLAYGRRARRRAAHRRRRRTVPALRAARMSPTEALWTL